MLCTQAVAKLPEHVRFCKITPDGAHVVATRTCIEAAGAIRELGPSDFPLLADEAARGGLCVICLELGGEDGTGLALYPNCIDPMHQIGCRACLLSNCKRGKNMVYIYRGALADKPPGLFCKECRQAAPIIKFREDMLALRAAVEAAFNALDGGADSAKPELAALALALAAEGVSDPALLPKPRVGGGDRFCFRVELEQQLAAAVKAVHLDQPDRCELMVACRSCLSTCFSSNTSVC